MHPRVQRLAISTLAVALTLSASGRIAEASGNAQTPPAPGQPSDTFIVVAPPPAGAQAPDAGGPMLFTAPVGCTPPGLPAGSTPPSPQAVMERFNRLAQTLGVSPDRLRAAIQQALPAPPARPDIDEPINRIAQGLGLNPDRVRQAFTPESGCGFAIPIDPSTVRLPPGPSPDGRAPAQLYAEHTARIAQALGVSPDRLREVLRQTIQPPPGLPAFDETLARIAQNLGLSSDRLRQALTETSPQGTAVGIFLPVPPPTTPTTPPRP
jgi:hypothetical protein